MKKNLLDLTPETSKLGDEIENLEKIIQISSTTTSNFDVFIFALCENGSLWKKRLTGTGEEDKTLKWMCINS